MFCIFVDSFVKRGDAFHTSCLGKTTEDFRSHHLSDCHIRDRCRFSFATVSGQEESRHCLANVSGKALAAGSLHHLPAASALPLSLVQKKIVGNRVFKHWSLDTGSRAGPSHAIALTTIGTLFLFLIPNAIIGWWEELVFRGYLLQNMIEGMGQIWALLASCVLYGVVHSMNPSASLLSSGIIVLFGFLRIYGFLATHQLWLFMGMHIGWNFFQGAVFGYAASGHETNSLIEQTPSGPVWLSGGAFGPEASVLIVPIVLLALLIMRWWVSSTRVTESHDAPA